jgi:ABC-2 type transport system ATP-binding protein
MDILKVEKLCKKLNGFSLQDVSFTLPGGCILGYVGENGAGKSTTIQTMFGLFHKDDGNVLFCGQPYDAEDQTPKEQIAVIFDDVCYHDCLTPVQIGKSMAGIYQTWSNETYGNMLERFHLPQKKPVKDFSRGMKMKLNLAVAFSHDTRLLVLDEATSGLDVVVREELFDLFREYISDEEHAILISSHILSDLEKVCDYIAFISDGKILLSDDKDSLLE